MQAFLALSQMLISSTHNFAFVHIQKTAGSSVTQAFVPYCRLIDRIVYGYLPTRKVFAGANRIFDLRDKGNAWATGLGRHAPLRDLRKVVDEQTYRRLFKFAFVRNPWDREVSFYFYFRTKRFLPDHKAACAMDFKSFLKKRMERQLRPQLYWVTDDAGILSADYIGYFESLDENIAEIGKRIMAPILMVPRTNVSKGRKHKDYRSFYDDESAQWVAEKFADDLRAFHYSFDSRSV